MSGASVQLDLPVGHTTSKQHTPRILSTSECSGGEIVTETSFLFVLQGENELISLFLLFPDLFLSAECNSRAV